MLPKVIADELVTHLSATTNSLARVVDEPADVIYVGALVIDTKAFDVTDDGIPVTLKPRDYSLLLALARGAGHTFTREGYSCLRGLLTLQSRLMIVRWMSTFDAYVSNSGALRRASRRSIALATG